VSRYGKLILQTTLNEQLLQEYAFFLANKAEGTIEAYLRTVRQVMIWVVGRPGNGGLFQPQQLTKTAVEMYRPVGVFLTKRYDVPYNYQESLIFFRLV